jgi:hypothetical protein
MLIDMRPPLCSVSLRITAVFALATGLVVFVGMTGGLATADLSEEPCLSCVGCETGECEGEQDNQEAHHHCCVSCCMSHASVAVASSPAASATQIAEFASASSCLGLIAQSPEAPFRPPRA